MREDVILVNDRDEPVGLMEKMEAHEKGLLHRAFSVFVINPNREILLQQRAFSKYHSGGLWTNTCCSHPRSAETTIAAAHRRLQEEMGFDCELTKIVHFIYKAQLDQGLTEHELDHVFVGYWDGEPILNSTEVADYKWMDIDAVAKDMTENPDLYTVWFKIIYQEFLKHVRHAGYSK